MVMISIYNLLVGVVFIVVFTYIRALFDMCFHGNDVQRSDIIYFLMIIYYNISSCELFS